MQVVFISDSGAFLILFSQVSSDTIAAFTRTERIDEGIREKMTQTSEHQTLLVGIAGGSASGKSTFVHILTKEIEKTSPALNVKTFSSDRYFRRDFSQIPTYSSKSFGQELPDFNHPDALNMAQLAADVQSTLVEENPPDVILVEGHLLFHDAEVRDLFDVRIFIDLDGETRALRRMVRNLEHKGDPIPDHSAQSIANYYLESARTGYQRYIAPTRQYADLILNGDGDFERCAGLVNAIITTRTRTG